MQLLGDIDELLDWFNEAEKEINSAPAISTDPAALRTQLRDHKVLNDDISNQKGKVGSRFVPENHLQLDGSMRFTRECESRIYENDV